MPDSIFDEQILPPPDRPRSRRRTQVAWWTMVSAILAFLASGLIANLYMLDLLRGSQIVMRETQLDGRRNGEIIRDCTQQGGECFERNQQNTARLVISLNDNVRYAAACADKPGVQGEEEIEECILDILRMRGARQ